MIKRSPVVTKAIFKFAKLWDIPADKLFALYKLYQKTALQGGEISAIFKTFGFVLDQRRINYMIRQIRLKIIRELNQK